MVKRGLVGVQLAISDAHAGLKAAIAKVLGCAWQRCTVHFLSDCFGHARKDQHGLLGALIRPIFAADSLAQARDRLSKRSRISTAGSRKIATMLEDAEAEILAFYAFPPSHWRKLRSTNPLERFNKEVGRRTDVVGIFPDDRSLIRLAGMLCIEQNDEWLVGRGYLSAESISLVLSRTGRSHHPRRSRRRWPSSKRPEPPTILTDDRGAELLHHVPGLDRRTVRRTLVMRLDPAPSIPSPGRCRPIWLPQRPRKWHRPLCALDRSRGPWTCCAVKQGQDQLATPTRAARKSVIADKAGGA